MGPLGLLDGKIIDLSENIVPMEDRGHQFGDGAYEVTRVYNRRCFALKPHMDRLYRSLRELRIPATYTFEELAGFHELLIKESGISEGGIYLKSLVAYHRGLMASQTRLFHGLPCRSVQLVR